MKPFKRIFLVLLLAALCFAQQSASLHSLPDITGTGAVVALSATSISARWVQIYAPSTNSGTAYCCDALVSSTRGQPMAAGGVQFLPASGPFYDLSTIYVLIANGDKIKVIYQY